MCYNLGYNEYSFFLIFHIFYLSKTYVPSVDVPVAMPFCSVWNAQLVRRRLTNEITMFDGYGKIDVRQLNVDQYFMVDCIFNISYINFMLMLTYYKYRFEKSKLGKKFHLHLIK